MRGSFDAVRINSMPKSPPKRLNCHLVGLATQTNSPGAFSTSPITRGLRATDDRHPPRMSRGSAELDHMAYRVTMRVQALSRDRIEDCDRAVPQLEIASL